MKYFRSYLDARAYCRNNELDVVPEKVNVWLDMSWESVWAVRTTSRTAAPV